MYTNTRRECGLLLITKYVYSTCGSLGPVDCTYLGSASQNYGVSLMHGSFPSKSQATSLESGTFFNSEKHRIISRQPRTFPPNILNTERKTRETNDPNTSWRKKQPTLLHRAQYIALGTRTSDAIPASHSCPKPASAAAFSGASPAFRPLPFCDTLGLCGINANADADADASLDTLSRVDPYSGSASSLDNQHLPRPSPPTCLLIWNSTWSSMAPTTATP